MLTVDPEQRTTVRQILSHPWMKDIASQVCTPFTSASDLASGSGSGASLLFCAQERVAKLTSGVSAAAAANLEQVVWPTPLEEGARSSSSGAASTDGLPGPPMASQSSLDDGPLSRLSSDSLNDAPIDDLDDVNDGSRPHCTPLPRLLCPQRLLDVLAQATSARTRRCRRPPSRRQRRQPGQCLACRASLASLATCW